jgi:hypothetical protein
MHAGLLQVEEPAAALPVAILSSVSVAGVLYACLSLVICAMVPYTAIQPGAPFSAALLSLIGPGDEGTVRGAFLAASARFVSFGAVTGADGLRACSQGQRMALYLCEECTLQCLLPYGVGARGRNPLSRSNRDSTSPDCLRMVYFESKP